ncbi:entry exclusion lipoprotein TrbK [Providencia rettgeri]|uniref:entry exclusion lipoprotein TrbK n=1 Tax=Providencia TaxID=586 RepID=UPI00141A4EAA|nr:entry exclusion lipoprotein TrbK [Providencia rettgeri]ELR5251549.1 entry exclusion lipoprotein TrbK [Providencia rettgeri]NIH04964.1 entry exclusion lipoprotein TrbK [Providencia rettgeri]
MNNLFFIVLTLFCVFLTGCERTIIEANKITCLEDNYEKSLLEIKDKGLQEVFISECNSIKKSKEMREWKFKSSPEDNF